MRSALILLALAGAPAAADTTYLINVSNRVTEVRPSAAVEVWAVFNADYYALADAGFDFVAPPDDGGFTDPRCILDGVGTDPGVVSPDGDSVTGILCGQIGWFNGFPEGFIDRSNPILIWTVTWGTADFSARSVSLTTLTKEFDVYLNEDLDGDGHADGTSASALAELVEGSGAIEVACYSDCSLDGSLDLFDFLCFLNAFSGGC